MAENLIEKRLKYLCNSSGHFWEEKSVFYYLHERNLPFRKQTDERDGRHGKDRDHMHHWKSTALAEAAELHFSELALSNV